MTALREAPSDNPPREFGNPKKGLIDPLWGIGNTVFGFGEAPGGIANTLFGFGEAPGGIANTLLALRYAGLVEVPGAAGVAGAVGKLGVAGAPSATFFLLRLTPGRPTTKREGTLSDLFGPGWVEEEEEKGGGLHFGVGARAPPAAAFHHRLIPRPRILRRLQKFRPDETLQFSLQLVFLNQTLGAGSSRRSTLARSQFSASIGPATASNLALTVKHGESKFANMKQ